MKLVFLCAIVMVSVSPVLAKERPWYKYENGYFEAYSDASEKKVRRILEELESFRTAVSQIGNFRVPEGAVKTQVVIFDSTKQFRETTARGWIAGYVVGVRGVPHIVMPVGGIADSSRRTIRHEYVHVLQGYSDVRSPPWYREGFAEFMAAVTIEDDYTTIIVGDYPERSKSPGSFVNWDELISDDFDMHQIGSSPTVSNAYLQSWLLVHYLTLGEDLAHNAELIEYLNRYARGESSESAFAQVFAEPVSEMGPRVYEQYRKGFQPLVAELRADLNDPEFARTAAPSSYVEGMIDELKNLVEETDD